MIRHVAPTLEAARAVIAGDVELIVVEGDWPAVMTVKTALGFGNSPLPRWVDIAITDGIRVEIGAKCEACRGRGEIRRWCARDNCDGGLLYDNPDDPSDWDACAICGDFDCDDCDEGLVVVGSVQATAVLPCVLWDFNWPTQMAYDQHPNGAVLCDPDGPLIMLIQEARWYFPTDLSVYGPPASLIGRYAIAVTDPRRTE